MKILLHGSRYRAKFGPHRAFTDWAEIRFTKVLSRETRDSVWSLVDALRNTKRRLPLAHAAFKHEVSQKELSSFRNVIFSANIDTALSNIQDRGFITSERDTAASEKKCLPTWLVIFLINQKVKRRLQTG